VTPNTASHPSTTAAASSVPRDFAADARRGPRDILVETRSNGDASASASIASISDQDWHISRTHGVYHIPARAPGEPYALVTITSRGDALDLGDNRRFPFTISARDIAEDLLQDLREHGIFVCAGERPFAEELASATARRGATPTIISSFPKATRCGRAAIPSAKFQICIGGRRSRSASNANGPTYPPVSPIAPHAAKR
jgi:hypothetical protein